MKFIILFGPPAVGKMSVGMELEKITGLKLFHNHMTIELVAPFFNFGSPSFARLVNLFRREIFKEVAKSNLEGLIFTFVWAFDLKSEEKYINEAAKIFQNQGADIYYIELEANLKERLKRNKTAKRLEHKPTKRDIKLSEKILLKHEEKHRFNTNENEFRKKNYIKINNTKLSAKKTAIIIKKKLKL